MDIAKEVLTKTENYKYCSKEEALAAEKNQRNRARRQRRHNAVTRLLVAQEEIESPMMKKRGGQRQWKMAMRCTYQQELRHQKQEKEKAPSDQPPTLAVAAGTCAMNGGDSDFAHTAR